MKNFLIPFLFIACLFMSACSDDNESLVLNNIEGTWIKQYPEGLQTEGFVEWTFKTTGELDVRVYDAFAGDSSTKYDYVLTEENKSIAIWVISQIQRARCFEISLLCMTLLNSPRKNYASNNHGLIQPMIILNQRIKILSF